VKIGVLALQGDFLEHAQLLRELGVEPVYVKKQEHLNEINALIIPGGESTTIGNLIVYRGLAQAITRFAEEGNPILGTCAGAILLAKKVVDRVVGETNQFTLGLMNISMTRNAFGRQNDSFETNVWIEGIGEVKAAFIRAPNYIECLESSQDHRVYRTPSYWKSRNSSTTRQSTSYFVPPRITGDKKVYEYLISIAKK